MDVVARMEVARVRKVKGCLFRSAGGKGSYGVNLDRSNIVGIACQEACGFKDESLSLCGREDG